MAVKKVLVLGATGNIGSLVTSELLKRGVAVKAVVRSAAKLSKSHDGNPLLQIVQAIMTYP